MSRVQKNWWILVGIACAPALKSHWDSEGNSSGLRSIMEPVVERLRGFDVVPVAFSSESVNRSSVCSVDSSAVRIGTRMALCTYQTYENELV